MKKFYRSRNNRMISGVCGGLGELTNVDVTLYRILLVVLLFFTQGAIILVYFIVSLVVPKAPDIFNPYQNQNGFGGPNGYNSGQGGPGGFNGGPGGPGGFNGGQGGFGGPGQYNNGRGPFNNQPNQTQYTSQRQWQAPPHQPPHTPPTQPGTNNIDSMMDDLEKKALRKEIEQLKQKLNEVEKKGE